MRRATCFRCCAISCITISIHALLAESDGKNLVNGICLIISIHALLAESDQNIANGECEKYISIHALLAESDFTSVVSSAGTTGISIHALLAESDQQSSSYNAYLEDFYPRSPCGERLFRQNYECFEWIISIHALLAESDLGKVNSMLTLIHFYPRSPCGERHTHYFTALHNILISIHALLAESDAIEFKLYFINQKFLSTLSLRRATVAKRTTETRPPFLSTLSLRRATVMFSGILPHHARNFYPRSPCGERQTSSRPAPED